MSQSFWKSPRSMAALHMQVARRHPQPHSVPFLLEEVHRRMLGRAQIMRPPQGPVYVHAWGFPALLDELSVTFPERLLEVIHLHAGHADQSAPFSEQSGLNRLFKRLGLGLGRSEIKLPAPAHHVRHHTLPLNGPLPLESGSQSLVWSPLWLHVDAQPLTLFGEWHRVLKPEGAVFFSCLGPDSARELSGLAQSLGENLLDFADMHDLGDALSRAGFSDPVMEMEKLTLTYTDPHRLLAEWRQLHGHTTMGRAKGLRTPRQFQLGLSSLPKVPSDGASRYPLTLELVYGHAWKVERKPKSTLATVSVESIGGRKTPGGVKDS